MKRLLILLATPCVLVGCSHTILSSSKQPGVVVVRKDKELADAVKLAQDGLPRFIARLKHPAAGEHFAIQARFRAKMNFEHLWVDHLSFDGALFHGKLADQPVIIQRMNKGDDVNFGKTTVSDWLIINGDKREGGFAEAVLKQKQGQ